MTATTSTDAQPFVKLKPGPAQSPEEVAEHQRARIHGAMVRLVADKGHAEGVKIRDVVGLAKVSSRSFYSHFDSKDDCFLRTYGDIVREVRAGLIAAQMPGDDWRVRARDVYVTFAQALQREPAAAHVALIGAYASSPDVLDRAYRTEENVIAMLAQSFERDPRGVQVPQPVAEGMIAGAVHVARARLEANPDGDGMPSEQEMMEWMLCFPTPEAMELPTLDIGSVRGNAALLEARARERATSVTGDRATILAAVAKLCAAEDYDYKRLTVPIIRGAAGVSRRTFDAHFDGVEHCVIAALELQATSAIADAATEQTAGRTWQGGVYRGLASLAFSVGQDPLLARIAGRDNFPPGSKGSAARRLLANGFVEQLRAGIPAADRPSSLITEASAGAAWALFHRRVLRDWTPQKPQIAATLAYMALAPLIGGPAAVAAIRDEQIR